MRCVSNSWTSGSQIVQDVGLKHEQKLMNDSRQGWLQ